MTRFRQASDALENGFLQAAKLAQALCRTLSRWQSRLVVVFRLALVSLMSELRHRLKKIEEVVGVRGKGFLLGLEFTGAAKAVHEALPERMIKTGSSSDANMLRR